MTFTPKGTPVGKTNYKFDPAGRSDGELYARPEPNPFTPEWCQGYDDGLEGRAGSLKRLPTGGKPHNYWDGYKFGTEEREQLDRTGSSNA